MDELDKIFEDFDEEEDNTLYTIIKSKRKNNFYLLDKKTKEQYHATILDNNLQEKKIHFYYINTFTDDIIKKLINGDFLICGKTYLELIEKLDMNIELPKLHVCKFVDHGDYSRCSCGKTNWHIYP